MRSVSNQSGLSITEVVMAMGIGAIVLGGVVSTLSFLNRSGMQYSLMQARNEIINKIRVQSLNTENLIASANMTETLGALGVIPNYGAANDLKFPDLLKKCLPDISGTDNYSCDKASVDDVGRGARFYLAENGSVDVEQAVAGEDIFYRNTGTRCSTTEASSKSLCPLAARVWFEPFCLNFASKCTKAMSLEVRYSIGIRSDFVTENAVATIEGEFYVPLQRGIQLTHLLNQNDVPIPPNSKGIFAIPKYNGSAGQFISGLRPEITVSNPYGLVSMRVQMRAVAGPAAKNYKDNEVPADLLSKSWSDVPTPSGTGVWAIDLTGAYPNQVFNFGTQSTVKVGSRLVAPSVAASFAVGSADMADPTYHWTVVSGAYQAPSFQSGLYQFRVLAKDTLGGEVESTNYLTVRIVPIPELTYIAGMFNPVRDCDSTALNFSVLVADDELMTFSEVTINGAVQATDTISGTDGVLNFSFDKSSPGGTYPITITLKDSFSDVSLDTLTVPKVVKTQSIVLTDYPNVINSIISNPPKIRVNTTGTLSVTMTTGNCCKSAPTITWNYPASSYFPGGLPLLAGDASVSPTCTSSAGGRTCSTENTVTAGTAAGPTLTTPIADVSAMVVFAGTASAACAMSSNTVSAYVPVVEIPTVYFLTNESLWLSMPAGIVAAIQPKVTVRSDFAPANDFSVEVANAADPTQVICTLTYTGSTSAGAAIDKSCDIPSSFSGELVIQKVAGSTNVQLEGEAGSSVWDAKLSGTLVHRACQANVTSLSGYPETYTVPETKAMNDSPYGFTMSGSTKVQDPKNDTGEWIVGRQKKLRCFQSWSTATDVDNVQDYSSVYKFNNDYAPVYKVAKKHTSWGSIGAPVKFGTYTVPGNPPLIIDTSARTMPYFFLVMQEGSPGSLIWTINEVATGASASTSPQPFEDVTAQFCSGSSTLNKIKIFRSPLSVESDTGNIIMKAANEMYTIDMKGHYSFGFMCDYGRWHPSGKASNNWID